MNDGKPYTWVHLQVRTEDEITLKMMGRGPKKVIAKLKICDNEKLMDTVLNDQRIGQIMS